MSAARDLFASLLLLAAMVLGALWLPAAWAERSIVDQSGFLDITEPLADDTAFQQTVTDSAVDRILGDERIPDWIADGLEPLAKEQAEKVTDTDMYGTLWSTTMRELHGALFTPGASNLDVDMEPAVEKILGGVEEHLPMDIPRPENTTITLATIPDVPLLTKATVLDPWAHRLGPIALVLAVVALLVAAHRRTMLTLAGVATIVAGGATWLLATRIESLVPDSLDQAVFLGPLVREFEQHFTADVMPQGVIMLGVGALIATVGLVLLGLHRKS